MTKVINSTSSKTIGTNKLNTVDVNTDKIIKSDSEFREVVKKGYLLNNINLSTIPDIIQNAINQAILDAKEQTLADAMIETLRLSILNLDDGIYKKTYIDNTITYLENLLVSKASPEIAASIAEAKIAIATAEFATTSQVNILSSRVNSSEAEIISIKETISTKDLARATQINELEANINDTFAEYSEAIDLIVDVNGNVKSQKIETLTTNIGLQLQEVNQLIVDTNNEWNAKSIKLITSPIGAITGYSFQDGSGIKSNFDIYADNFKISNSYNTYSPFSIVGTSLYFNGKVTFSNVTGTDGIVTTSNVQTVFNSEVTTIDGGKIATNSIGANQINTVGLIAENISANEIVGKTLVGAVINGASINGAVIKASYLDLDGELEVLTNYHITVAMYNANPSLYTDAVYLSGTNEYRIPSLSTIREATISQNLTTTGTIYGVIWSYNTANVGNNLKAVKIRPDFSNQTSFTMINSICSDSWFGYNFTYGIKNHFRLSLGDTILVECKVELIENSAGNGNDDITRITISGSQFTTITHSIMSAYNANDLNVVDNLNIGIGTLLLNTIVSGGSYSIDSSGYSAPNNIEIVGTLLSGTQILPFNWTNGRLKFEQIITPSKSSSLSTSEKTIFSLNQSLYINNMI